MLGTDGTGASVLSVRDARPTEPAEGPVRGTAGSSPLRSRRLPALVRHRWTRRVVGLLALAVATSYLAGVVDARVLERVAGALLADPLGLAAALGCYAVAFAVRARAWSAVLTGLGFSQSWAALHVSLLGNHVLPFRLGEALRVTSVLRRTNLPTQPVVASAVTLRLADLVAILGLALLAAPGLAGELGGPWIGLGLAAAVVAGVPVLLWLRRVGDRHGAVRRPGVVIAVAACAAWALEASVLWEVARVAGVALSPVEAVTVTAVTIAAQTVAVTPGGIGTYEAAATAALVALGVAADVAFAVALTTHAVKTAYALVVGGAALVWPAPSYWGYLRLPRKLPARPPAATAPADAPIVAVLPAHNEAATVAHVIGRLPHAVAGRRVVPLVVDDGSSDATAELAARAGAVVHRHPVNLGLGAALRRGLAEAVRLRPAAVVYLDADGEYAPEDVLAVSAPVLAGTADYVVGSRFAGRIDRMLPQRRMGNLVLTSWVRWLTRRRDLTDGQSGFRAFSPAAAAAAEIVHDYNYAQVLTLDLLGKGYTYAEVPIRYSFRQTGTSFVRLGCYLRRVVPAVHRELNCRSDTMPL